MNPRVIFRRSNDVENYFSELVAINGDRIDLNESSEKVVMECDGSNSIGDIASKLSALYDKTSPEVIEKRTISLLNTLNDQGFIFILDELAKEGKRTVSPKNPLGKYPLKYLFIECTNACNLKCIHCYLGDIGQSAELPLPHLKKMLKEFSDDGGEHITLSGGEPLLRKGIFDILEYASSLPLFITLFSNGIFITGDIAKKLKQYNIQSVQISLDGAKPETHDAFRGMKGAYVASVKAVEALLKVGLKVGIATVINKSNLNELKEIIDQSKAWGTVPNLAYFEPKGRANQQGRDYLLTYHEYFEALVKIRKYITENTDQKPFKAKVPEKLSLDAHRCSVARNSLAILCNGDVYPCLDFIMPEAKLGNIADVSLKEIWNSENNYLAKLRKSCMRDLKFCVDCKHLIYCGGGCPVMAYNTWGDYNMPDPKKCIYYTMTQDYLVLEKEDESKEQTFITCDK